MGIFLTFLGGNLQEFFTYTGFANATIGNLVMILIGLGFIALAIKYEYSPLLLIPVGFGLLIGNIPFGGTGLQLDIYEEGSVFNILYKGVVSGLFPALIFLGLGAMTDFSGLLSNSKLMLVGAASQIGIFGTYMLALQLGFDPAQAGAIGMIGGAGPAAVFLSAKLAPELLCVIAVIAFLFMAVLPVIQEPIMRLCTSNKDRVIRMKLPRAVSQTEKIVFSVAGLLLTSFFVPSALPLLGMLFFGNLLKESGVTRRLAETARGPLFDIATIFLGLTVGISAQADYFLTLSPLKIFVLGAFALILATALGVLFVKFMNLFLREENKINPLIGNAGIAALPESARISQKLGLEYDPKNHLQMHAAGANVAGVIGAAIAAGLLLSFLG